MSAASWAGSATGAAPAWNRASAAALGSVSVPDADRLGQGGQARVLAGGRDGPAAWPRARSSCRARPRWPSPPASSLASAARAPRAAGLGHHRDLLSPRPWPRTPLQRAPGRPRATVRAGQRPQPGAPRPAAAPRARPADLGEAPAASTERWGTGRGGGHDTNLDAELTGQVKLDPENAKRVVHKRNCATPSSLHRARARGLAPRDVGVRETGATPVDTTSSTGPRRDSPRDGPALSEKKVQHHCQQEGQDDRDQDHRQTARTPAEGPDLDVPSEAHDVDATSGPADRPRRPPCTSVGERHACPST